MPQHGLLDPASSAVQSPAEPLASTAATWELGLSAGCDALIFIAYFTIPAQLYWFLKDIPQTQSVLRIRLHFILFIISCGLSHLAAAAFSLGLLTGSLIVFLSKAITATVSIKTACLLWQHAGEVLWLFSRTSELELYVNELEKTNTELAYMRKAAELNALTAKSLLSSVSHELRTPIHSIKGTIDILRHELKDQEHRRLLKDAQSSASTLLDIVTKILTYTSLSRRQFATNRRPTSVAWIVEQAMDISKLQISDKDMRGVLPCIQLCPSAPQAIETDDYLLIVALRSIVENAIKYTDSGHVVVRAYTRRERMLSDEDGGDRHQQARQEEGQRRLRKTSSSAVSLLGGDMVADHHDPSEPNPPQTVLVFQVADTGIGIPQQMKSRVFDHLWRADTTNYGKHSGLGLGLAICDQAINLLGGGVHVYDNTVLPGNSRGSVFEVLVPIPDYAPDSLAKVSQVPSFSLPNFIVQNLQAIISSDDIIFVMSLESLLRYFGVSSILICNRTDCRNSRNMDGSLAFLGPDAVSDSSWSAIWSHWETEQPGRRRVLVASQLPFLLSSKNPNSPVLSIEPPAPPSALAEILHVAQSSVGSSSPMDFPCTPTATGKQGTTRFLIVDDYRVNLKLAESMVSRACKDAVIVTADDGLVAIDKWKEACNQFPDNPFDIVLMDLSMPRVDGREATRQIRNLFMGDTPFISALTGDFLEDTDEQQLRQEGFDKVLMKPLTMKTLRAVLTEASHHQQLQAQGRR
mmetsp:Transcript_35879/g.101593  ORF Transcript_35879/g.101593 Transcript_35879/m.101593 type:complete len:748 (+) Transcript_35879:488-2731(+)